MVDKAQSYGVKMIGDYALGRLLGRGTFCKVKIATHIPTGRQYAVKIMKQKGKQSWADIERELSILSGFRHPNIIELHETMYVEHGSSEIRIVKPGVSLAKAKILYLVVNLAEKGELFDYIATKGRLTENEARSIFRQIVSAVEYIHAHCVAHRDLKPENILIDSTGTIKLNDFGLSNFIQPEGRMKTFCGSPIYAAPEVMQKTVYSGSCADVWSLGVILYVMVTCMLPWRLQGNKVENLEDLLAGRFEVPSEYKISQECVLLLSKMIVPNPDKRASLNEVRKHPWVNRGYTDYAPRHLEENSPVQEIDGVVLKQMEDMGFMQARVSSDVLKNKQKPSVTIYHTLLKRRSLTLSSSGIDEANKMCMSPNVLSTSTPNMHIKGFELAGELQFNKETDKLANKQYSKVVAV